MKKSNYPIKFGHRYDPDFYGDLQDETSNTLPNELHWHNSFEVAYQIKGQRTYTYPDGQHILKKGEILLIPPHTFHGTLPNTEDMQQYVFGYPTELIYSHEISFGNLKFLLAFLGETSFERCLFGGDSKPVCELRKEIQNLFELSKQPMNKLVCRASILKIHDAFYKLYNHQRNTKLGEFTAGVINCIENNFSQKLTPYMIADLLHISHSSLCHKLKSEINKTPNELILEYRLNYAENLLINSTELSITEIGLEIGIPDTSYFIKVFKRSRGITPLAFRKSIIDKMQK